MNCRRFQDQLFEYVEGSLSAGELAAAQQHLAACTICQKAAQNEEHRARALSNRLRQMSGNLTLRPEIARNVLREFRTVRPDPSESLAALWMRRPGLAAIAVSLLLIAACALGFDFFGRQLHRASRAPVARHSLPPPPPSQPPAVSVELSYRMPVHEFRQEGNDVVDSFVDETVVASMELPADGQKPVPRQDQPKTSL